MLAHPEINSACGKNSRKYGIIPSLQISRLMYPIAGAAVKFILKNFYTSNTNLGSAISGEKKESNTY